MLADYPTLDLENGLWTWANYETFDKEGISIQCCEPYYKKLFELAEKLQNLCLTTGEANVLRAVVLFNPGMNVCTFNSHDYKTEGKHGIEATAFSSLI